MPPSVDDHNYTRTPLRFYAKSMYPKVKVRQEEDDPTESQMKDFQSLSYDHPSNSPEHKDDYTCTAPAPLVRVPRCRVSGADARISARPAQADRKGVNKPTSASVLPPRAVLSSPDNDAMLGTKNKTKTERDHEREHAGQNTHVKCKKYYEMEKKSRWK